MSHVLVGCTASGYPILKAPGSVLRSEDRTNASLPPAVDGVTLRHRG